MGSRRQSQLHSRRPSSLERPRFPTLDFKDGYSEHEASNRTHQGDRGWHRPCLPSAIPSALRHAPGAARGAEPSALAGEGEQLVVTAVGAAGSGNRAPGCRTRGMRRTAMGVCSFASCVQGSDASHARGSGAAFGPAALFVHRDGEVNWQTSAPPSVAVLLGNVLAGSPRTHRGACLRMIGRRTQLREKSQCLVKASWN